MSVRSHSHAVFTLLLCIPAQRTRSHSTFARQKGGSRRLRGRCIAVLEKPRDAIRGGNRP